MRAFFSILTLISPALGAKHHFFVGTFGTPYIYGVEFDNVSNALNVTKNPTLRPENEWLALSHDSKTLYSSGKSGWTSYNLTSPVSLSTEPRSLPAGGKTCGNWNGVFVMASRRPPYPLYGTLTCANWVSTTPEGALGAVTEVPYNEGAIIYGMASDPNYNYLYSSDWKGGQIWTHRINTDGSLTVVGSVPAPSNTSSPRTIQVHPSGKALYVVLEAWNVLALYYINQTTHLPYYSNGLYPLVPSTANAGQYSSKSAALSSKGSMIFMTAHSRVPGQPGYMTGLTLSETGTPTGELWQVKTPTSGGHSLTVATCPWSEKVVALAESEVGSVSVWQATGGKGGNAEVIATVKIKDTEVPGGGCCSDAVWLD